MIHPTLQEHLTRYQKQHPEEAATVGRFLQFTGTHPNCFDRELTVGHITASAWVVNRDATHVLLTHHKKLNLWLQLGGHADGNDNVMAVALCEAQEESGIQEFRFLQTFPFDLDIHRIPDRPHEPSHYHYDLCFLLQTVHSEATHVSEESHALAWVPIDALHDFTQESSLMRMQQKWQKRKTITPDQ